MPEYINNKKLEECIGRYRVAKLDPGKKTEFQCAEMELTKSFYLLSEKIYLAYKYIFASNLEAEEAVQEGVLICLDKIHRFNPEIGKAFPFFTQIIVNHYKQLCRSAINYKNLTLKYRQHLWENIDDVHIGGLKSRSKSFIIQNFINNEDKEIGN